MCKTEIANRVLEIVSKETEVSVQEIKGKGKTIDIVDARYLVVYFLYKNGFYTSDISRIIGIGTHAVRLIIRNFDTRRTQSGMLFEINLKRIGKRLENDSLMRI